MFNRDTPMVLQNVNFGLETENEETTRIVVCSFLISPFTSAQADELNIRSLLFDASTGTLKPAVAAVTALLGQEDQRLSFAMAPDSGEPRIVLPNVRIEERLKCKIKQDRDPLICEAILKISFAYPTADQLLYIANGVNDTHFLTFEPEQLDLLADDDHETIRKGRPHAAATAH